MNQVLQQLLQKYELTTHQHYENALKEIIQELALLGLWRSRFFERAAFYGGTCLRIFYNLDRFSEDLDFSLLQREDDFSLDSYLGFIERELVAFGFSFDVKTKEKSNHTQMESAFIKGNTLQNLIQIEVPQELLDKLNGRAQLKVKLEVDTNPPDLAETEFKTLLVPIPFQVRTYSMSSLFSGKLHAILCRKWKNRVKGRDFYDFIWYLGQQTVCDIDHLKMRMVQSGHFPASETLNHELLIAKLKTRFSEIDFEQAKRDVSPFIRDQQALELWSNDFFISLLDKLKSV